MLTLYTELKTILRKKLDAVIDETGAPLVFGHICMGDLQKPGAFRLTHIVLGENGGSPLVKLSRESGVSHEAAFGRHINVFGRHAALLDWITLWLHDNCRFVEPHTPRDERQFSFLISAAPDALYLSASATSVTASGELCEDLLPQDVVARYLVFLYSSRGTPPRSAEPIPFEAQRLMGARSACLRRMQEDRHQACRAIVASLSGKYDRRNVPESYRDWAFLGALQTGLMYARASFADGSDSAGFVSFGCCYNLHRDPTCIAQNPVGIISAVLPRGPETFDSYSGFFSELLSGELDHTIHQVQRYHNLPDGHRLAVTERGQWPGEKISTCLEEEIQRVFEVSAFPGWTHALLVWMAMVVEHLRGAKHEQRSLNFCFVVADKSQVLDSGVFDVLALMLPRPGEDDYVLLPWDKEGNKRQGLNVGKLLDVMKREISKKNYAWFQEGKYALLWDATFPSAYPSALIRFRDSSWDVFLNDVRMRRLNRATAVIPALVYIRGDGSGGIVLEGRHVYSFRGSGQWSRGDGNKQGRIREYLRQHVNGWDVKVEDLDRLCSIMADALVAIAEDPDSGCMLVVYCAKNSPHQFRRMGEPWLTEHGDNPLAMSCDELTALMSMDGATCLYADTSVVRVAFRRLVSVPDGRIAIKEQDEHEHLDGRGARTWSGAYAAGRPGVATVFNVSQDGPITVYEKDEATGEVCLKEEF
jgi:hypothetical protein